jgi:hypothetical protein
MTIRTFCNIWSRHTCLERLEDPRQACVVHLPTEDFVLYSFPVLLCRYKFESDSLTISMKLDTYFLELGERRLEVRHCHELSVRCSLNSRATYTQDGILDDLS